MASRSPSAIDCVGDKLDLEVLLEDHDHFRRLAWLKLDEVGMVKVGKLTVWRCFGIVVVCDELHEWSEASGSVLER
jgi:hypothetical protein